MQHVTGLDQMFLSYDTMTTNGNIGGIAIFDDDGKGGPKAEPGARLAWLRQRVTDRLPTLPLALATRTLRHGHVLGRVDG